jgi:hypothetical protein
MTLQKRYTMAVRFTYMNIVHYLDLQYYIWNHGNVKQMCISGMRIGEPEDWTKIQISGTGRDVCVPAKVGR